MSPIIRPRPGRSVVVLGAGASADYGFPTGRRLLLEIGSELSDEHGKITRILLELGHSEQAIRLFREALIYSGLPSVDIFIENRKNFMQIGKHALAAALIPYENPSALHRDLMDRPEVRWYEHMLGLFAHPKELLGSNEILFVTFNYDRSLEHYYFNCLKHSTGATDSELWKIMPDFPCVHAYGSLGGYGHRGRHYSNKLDASEVQSAADQIKIFSEKTGEEAHFARIRSAVAEADNIWFLGFGFHEANLARLDIDHRKRQANVFGTAMGLGRAATGRISDRFEDRILLGGKEEGVLEFIQDRPFLS